MLGRKANDAKDFDSPQRNSCRSGCQKNPFASLAAGWQKDKGGSPKDPLFSPKPGALIDEWPGFTLFTRTFCTCAECDKTTAFMAFDGLLISEIFYSLQGETSASGLPFIFIRMTGCNLRCSYCDSAYSFKGGEKRSIDETISLIQQWKCKQVLLTGGEPLMQRNTLALAKRLHDDGYVVSIETHGHAPINDYATFARIIMDVKTPGSKMNRDTWIKNLEFLKPSDELKFVITSAEDYEWARTQLREFRLADRCSVLFSPANHHKESPGSIQGFDPTVLAEKILEDQLPVRFQLQLHKLLWGAERRGV